MCLLSETKNSRECRSHRENSINKKTRNKITRLNGPYKQLNYVNDYFNYSAVSVCSSWGKNLLVCITSYLPLPFIFFLRTWLYFVPKPTPCEFMRKSFLNDSILTSCSLNGLNFSFYSVVPAEVNFLFLWMIIIGKYIKKDDELCTWLTYSLRQFLNGTVNW